MRGLADGQRHVARQDEIDLLVEEPIFLGHGDRDEQDAEDVVAVTIEGRSRSGALRRRREQLLERAPMEVDGGLGEKLVARRVEEIDPAHARTHEGEGSGAVGRSCSRPTRAGSARAGP